MKYIIILLLVILAFVGWKQFSGDLLPNNQSEQNETISKSLEQETMVEDYEIIIDIPYTNIDRIDVSNALRIEVAKSEIVTLASETPNKVAPYTLSMSGVIYPVTKSGLATQVVTTGLFTGGAHGSESFETTTYSPDTGRIYTLDQIVDINDGSMNFLFSQVKNNLKDRDLDPEWLEEGSGLNLENYDSFYVTDRGITFIFEQYQIASYAQGTIEVSVSWDELAPYLRGGFKKLFGFSNPEAETETEKESHETTETESPASTNE